MQRNNRYWIWYPGDFEIHHGMKQNFSREERGFNWPAYWYMDDCFHNVRFYGNYDLENNEKIIVYARGIGHVLVNNVKYPFEQTITCPSGKVEIQVIVGNMAGLPSIYVEGDTINSDNSWFADEYVGEKKKVGYNYIYTNPEQDPNVTELKYETKQPINVEEDESGVLYDFGKEMTAQLIVNPKSVENPLRICYGESITEAKDIEDCYYWDSITDLTESFRSNTKAFRYIYIPGIKEEQVNVKAEYEYFPIEVKGSFTSSDDLINDIWSVSQYTFQLNSGMFFLDGIKRDRWIWSGDAYQSYLINQYLFFDEEINKRTIIALRGKDPIRQHINTIVDYSLLWILSIENHYMATGDKEFLEYIYPKMESMMDYCLKRTDENGFIIGLGDDWIFVDWAEMDKTGSICAEQILFARSIQVMDNCSKILNKNGEKYKTIYTNLYENVQKYFWNDELGAFIDSYESGKNNVTRHANVFAILFDFVNKNQGDLIMKNVILNENIQPITTPYFKFYELDVLCKLGFHDKVLEVIKDYWGGMLDLGATTFWEEYDPKLQNEEHYGMYGDKYGKSLCHAWGASPIYIIGKHFMGVRPTSPGYESFEVAPNLETFDHFDCEIPIKNGFVKMKLTEKGLNITCNRVGGILKVNGKEYEIPEGELEVKISDM